MTRVDFYLLSAEAASLSHSVCRLCEKATGAGHKLYIFTPDPQLQSEMDKSLWSFRQGGFIPHEPYTGREPSPPAPPILIGEQEAPPSHHDIMINLAESIPPWFSCFERVLEVVQEASAPRAASREKFRFYRERGYALKTFQQSADGGWQQK